MNFLRSGSGAEAAPSRLSRAIPVPLYLPLSLSHFTDYTDRAAENGGGGGRVIDARRSNGRGRRRGRRGGGELRVSDFEGEGGK